MTCNFLTQATLKHTHTHTLVQRMQLKGTPRRNLHSSWKRFKKWSEHKKGERRIRRTYKAGAKTFSRRSQWPSPLLLLLFATLPLFRVCPKQGTAHPKSGKKARLPAWPMWLQFLDYGVAWIFLSVPKPRHKQSGRSPSAINPVEIQHTHTQLRNKQKQRNIKKTDGQRKQLSQWREKSVKCSGYNDGQIRIP